MSKAASVTYIDFQKKKNVSEQSIYNSWYDKWIDIKRACDPSKTIAHEAIAFITAIEFLFLKNSDEVIFNKKLLQKKCTQGERQRSRYLKQLADLYEITPHTSYEYKGKKYHFVYSAKRTKNSLEILQNPKEFYKKSAINLVKNPDKNDLDTRQKCLVSPTNLSATYIDNRKPIEEINSSYAREFISESSILKTDTNTRARENKHATFAPCSFTEPEQVALTIQEEKSIELERKTRSEENTGLVVISDLMTKILKEPQKSEEAQTVKQEELREFTDKKARAMLLSKAFCMAFGEQRANEIQDDYKFVEQNEKKVSIQAKQMLLNDIEKAKIRKAVRSVYGEDVILATQVITLPLSQDTQASYRKQSLIDFKVTISDSSLVNILNNRLVKIIETGNGIIIESMPFLIDQLTEAGNLAKLEDAVVKTGITLEMHYSNKDNQYANTIKKPIVLTPEKVRKDREWLENHRKN